MSVTWTSDLKGCTVWFTGLSGSGKTTVSKAVRDYLFKYNIPVKNLDGDELRTGLNSGLGFSKEDRRENIRRVAEVAALFASSGFITLVSLISPYAEFRQAARVTHEKKEVKFFEAYVNTPLDVCEQKDVKDLYRKARAGQLADFTGVSMNYEVPSNPDVIIEAGVNPVDECMRRVLRLLVDHEFIPKSTLECVDLQIPVTQLASCREAATLLPKIELSRTNLEWLQVVAEGWATPLEGFMTRDEYLQCLHFKTITKNGMVHSQSIPIVLPITDAVKQSIGSFKSVCLIYQQEIKALLTDIEIYGNRKKERCARTFGSVDGKHPTINNILNNEGNWLIGGKLRLFERITWKDGLDKYRLKPAEINARLAEMQADAVFVFQLRNPLHNGHILLINETKRQLKENGHSRPVLLLHPIGGWTKDDDIPLAVRMKQHQVLLDEGVLDKDSTILSIFPSPMSYAGPTEVQWHAKGRLVAGVNYYIVGRDPAGLKDPSDPNNDLYDPFDGSKVLQMAPGLNRLNIIPFRMAALNKKLNQMTFFDPNNVEDFETISGTRMRQIARDKETPPEQFMNPAAWKVLADYYNALNTTQIA